MLSDSVGDKKVEEQSKTERSGKSGVARNEELRNIVIINCYAAVRSVA